MGATLFVQQLINGVSLGSLYALIAIGYTMVYGILRLINFAHGDLLMVSAYAAIYGILLFSLPWFLSFPLAIIATGAIGILLDRARLQALEAGPAYFIADLRNRGLFSDGKSCPGDSWRCSKAISQARFF